MTFRHQYAAEDGTILVRDERIAHARPTPLNDVQYTNETGQSLPSGSHAVRLPDGSWGLETAMVLHDAAMARRGRPYALTLPQMTAARTAYWSGKASQSQLCSVYRVSRPTMHRIVHGMTAWYA